MSAEKPVRCEVVFRGHVHGVGFRFTAVGVANCYPVSGYVMNVRDGTVRMVAEGLRPDVMHLIRDTLHAMRGYVQGHEERWGEASGEFRGFDVRYEGR